MKSNTVQILTTVLSNVAVLAGLVFLIFELRQNSAIALSQVSQQRTLSLIDEYNAFGLNKEASALFSKLNLLHDFESITTDEWVQIRFHEFARRHRIRDVWFQFQRGLITLEIYNNSLSIAAGREDLWDWLELPPARIMSEQMSVDIQSFKSANTFRPSEFTKSFSDWSKNSQNLSEYLRANDNSLKN